MNMKINFNSSSAGLICRFFLLTSASFFLLISTAKSQRINKIAGNVIQKSSLEDQNIEKDKVNSNVLGNRNSDRFISDLPLHKAKISRKESYWGLHFDQHLSITSSHVGAALTEGMVDSLLMYGRPDYIQVDCKGHPGVSSYPTEVGQQAVSFDKDPLALLRKITEKNQVSLYVHYSGVWDANYVRLHPDQARVQPNGTPDPNKTSFWGNYSDKLLIPQLKELALKYKIDGAWIDGEAWALQPDYHPAALAEFKKTTGIDSIPRKPSDKYYKELLEFNRKSFLSYIKHYTKEIHQAAPNFQLCSNWAFSGMMPEPIPDDIGLNFYSGDNEANNSLNQANWHARTLAGQGIAFDLMAWSFTMNFKTWMRAPKTSLQLCQELAPVISMGGGVQTYFNQKEDVSFKRKDFRIIKELADFILPRRDFCKGVKIIPQIALLYSTAGWKETVDVIYQSAKMQKMQGILNSLLDGQHAVEVLMTHQMLKRLNEFPVVVIPEWQLIEPELETAFRKYVDQGGKLLIVGATATARFDDLLGVKELKATTARKSYLNVADRFIELDTDIRSVAALPGTTVLNQLYPLDDLVDPSDVSATIRDYGKGKIAGIYISLAESYLDNTSPVIRDLLSNIVNQLLPDPFVKIEGSHLVNIVPTTKDKKILIQLINTSGNHANENVKGLDEIAPIYDLKLSVSTRTKPVSVLLQPGAMVLKYKYYKGRTEVIIPKLPIHQIVEIK